MWDEIKSVGSEIVGTAADYYKQEQQAEVAKAQAKAQEAKARQTAEEMKQAKQEEAARTKQLMSALNQNENQQETMQQTAMIGGTVILVMFGFMMFMQRG